ncbi:hypothetical protein D1816_22965 [Aquimarina sp. AD10]|uniref:DUF6236 family protein n=1 Tax=Aquimarina sp. AD10 TaxID=1714849 RepID=UPI000E529C70|nr:DUF6236 family protein [Aquimarina sp. AD10]AXT63085.1 hypothetical protein D1816_22965 [Aquimarina sp. AD10]RKM96886.1 hypothetical protein D7033_15340 [Aquimarina sp. AD10]
MGFTKALYYPTIDIQNSDWAKSAVLFWDNIQTIVPESINTPYKNRVSKILNDEGLLTPHFVNPDHNAVRDLASDVTNFLETNEGFDFLVSGRDNGSSIHVEKLPRELKKFSRIHREKLPYAIKVLLEDQIHRNGWLEVNSVFVGFYMTLLANKICERERLVLLTDNSIASKLTDKAKLDNQRKIVGRSRQWDYDRNENTTLHLSQGILSNLILKGIRFSPDTKTEDIIKFKRKHKDELGLFRINLEKLVSDIPDDIPFETLQQNIKDIYTNEFEPSYNNFKKALDGFKLKWINDHVMKVAFFKTGTGALLPYLLGVTIPQALFAGIGISIVTSAISYNEAKKTMLRENPYSYLVSAEKELNKEDFRKALTNRIY